MRTSTNYGLALYDTTDTFNITGATNSLNNNTTIIDSALYGKVDDSYVSTIGSELTTVTRVNNNIVMMDGTTFTGAGSTTTLTGVSPGEKYYISGYQYYSGIASYAFFNGDTFVSAYHYENYDYDEGNFVVFKEQLITIPEGADTLKVNGKATNDTYYGKVYSVVKTSQYRVIEQWVAGMPTSMVTLDQKYYKKGVLRNTGETNSNGHRAAYKVTPGEKLYVTGTNVYSDWPLCVYLDADDEVIGTTSGLSDLTNYTDYEVTIPGNTALCIVNAWDALDMTNPIAKANRTLSIGDYIATYMGNNTSYKGKTAVFFGTSIPAGYVTVDDADISIPTYAGKLLGMTIINEAVGSSSARRGWYTRKTDTDPYGWTNLGWEAVTRTMGATVAEKNDFINNYQSKWKALINDSSKPDTIDETLAETIRNYSYERKLVPYLDGTYEMPDLFIFEHGYNDKLPDWVSGQGLVLDSDYSPTLTSSNTFDMSYYADAMLYYFTLIWNANPHAKIMMVSHYNRDSDTGGKYIWPSQKTIAENNGVPFCDIASNIGWSTQPYVTNGYWDEDTQIWIADGGQQQVTTRRQACLYDDLHPHSDKSGKAIKREGELIAKFISSNITL